MTRLAEAHCISVKEIAKFAILHSSNRDTSSCNLKKINGQDAIPQFIVEGLERLTGRTDLHLLGTLSWKGLFKRGVLKDKKAWCPFCFNEWINAEAILYEPLIWQFKDIHRCYRHRTPLQLKCRSCEAEMETLENLGKVGYCIHCSTFLGEEYTTLIIIEEPETIEESLKAANVVADLIVNAHEVANLSPERYIFRTALDLKMAVRFSSDDDEGTPYENLKRWTRS
jgi:hypothetical protein